jgi:hypothetical protein
MFQQLEQRFHDAGSVTPKGHLNVHRSQTVWTPTNEYAMISDLEQEP